MDIILGCKPDLIIPYASLILCKTLSEEGLDGAVARWNSSKLNHPDECDFDPQQFSNLITAMDLEIIQDAESMPVYVLEFFQSLM